MNIDEAIKHCRDKAEELRKEKRRMALLGREEEWGECLECAKEHEQLADWLEELKARREADNDKVN